MGQAKRRGTFEERKEAAMIKSWIEMEERRKLDLERKSRMTEEELQRKYERATLFAQLMAMAWADMPYSVRRVK